MATVAFDRDSQAVWYAKQHLATDAGVDAVYHLPKQADDREIRLVEVNHEIGEVLDECLEAVEYRIDRGMDTEHRLLVLDVTPAQWSRLEDQTMQLPAGWSMDGCKLLKKRP